MKKFLTIFFSAMFFVMIISCDDGGKKEDADIDVDTDEIAGDLDEIDDVDAEESDIDQEEIDVDEIADDMTDNITTDDDSTQIVGTGLCYTPCKDDYIKSDGTFIKCSSEGLMAGCYFGTVCVNGTCVKEEGGILKAGEPVGTCEEESDCPDFQTCLGGICGSNCEKDGDCNNSQRCHRKVCREKCSPAESNSCIEKKYCKSVDGNEGVCMPLTEAEEDSEEDAGGTYDLSSNFISLSNVKMDDTFTITNNSRVGREFLIKKIRHSYKDSDGIHTVEKGAMSWILIGESGSESAQNEFSIFIEAGSEAEIGLVDNGESDKVRWNGVIEVSNEKMGVKEVTVTYASVPEGQWSGKMMYFANFSDKNLYEYDSGTENGWYYDRDDVATKLGKIGNAFLQKWGNFRNGKISYDEISAAITAMTTGSWSWSSTMNLCASEVSDKAACFLYDNSKGFITFTDNREVKPVPSGLSELPFSINLEKDPANVKRFTGRIESTKTLQYYGYPYIDIEYAMDPSSGDTCSAIPQGGDCIIHIDDFYSTIYLGGRFKIDSNESCPEGFSKIEIPWLVNGFDKNTAVDEGVKYRYECRQKDLPIAGDPILNSHIAGSNPVPDGKYRKRVLEMIDGVLVNQEVILIVFRETFDGFVSEDDEGFSSYGIIRLHRSPETLEDEDYEGNNTAPSSEFTENVLDPECSQDLLDELNESGGLNSGNAEDIMLKILEGAGSGASLDPIDGTETAHYLCVDTGTFDGATYDGNPVICPGGSEVIYFTLTGKNDISGESCNNSYSENELSLDNSDDYSDSEEEEYDSENYSHNIKRIENRGSCKATLDNWINNDKFSIRMDPTWYCTDSNMVYCDSNREDLLDGKTFYKESSGEPIFLKLKTLIDSGFRYKTRFRSRSGASIGFAPETCADESDLIPYCYSPEEVERVEERTNCLLAIYNNYYDDLDEGPKENLVDYLIESFSYEDEVHDGFERLNAELLIMMGDESYTNAFASRFDLAGSNIKSFQGSLFEPDGIDLSGGAGYEMYSLYQAVQYYQMVLDRFYSISPVIWKAINSGTTNSFITQETVTSYFDKLIRASSQKTRAWSQISKKYQSFNRPDLARLVVEKAYTAAYLESVIISKIMLKVADVTETNKRDQITYSINQAQLFYKMALLEMRDVYADITDDINFFGFAPEYIPFPALDEGDDNAFEKLYQIAIGKLDFAAKKESDALNSDRSFETDAASFQSELVNVRNNYENQLAELCGTMEGDDGRIYPAIPKYAHLNEEAKLIGNPCGLAGNGAIHEAMGEMEIKLIDYELASGDVDDISELMKIEVERHNAFCEANDSLADYNFEVDGSLISIEQGIQASTALLNTADRIYEQGKTSAELAKCSIIAGVAAGGDCPAAGVAMGLYNACMAAYQVIAIGLETTIATLEVEKLKKEQARAKWETEKECDFDAIESNAALQELAMDREDAVLEAVKAGYRLSLAVSKINKLRNEAKRLVVQQEESEQLLINVIAAKNDPNVRIYKNDAVINADKAFNSALAAAYRATKVYEYYTSQSYAKLDQLFLIRMVSYGDYNLENYMYELYEAFYEFEEEYGNPDTRVAILSLRDDIIQIPRTGENGTALSEAERTKLFRETITGTDVIDSNGHINIPFSTNLTKLSPFTRNHKIKFIEAEVIGSDTGDSVGRIYLHQRGTGALSSLFGDRMFYKFPERMAVIDTYFNGQRWYDSSISDFSVFRSERFRDRPFANTHWEFILNNVDEEVNEDINLDSLTDIKVYIYYTDFTEL